MKVFVNLKDIIGLVIMILLVLIWIITELVERFKKK